MWTWTIGRDAVARTWRASRSGLDRHIAATGWLAAATIAVSPALAVDIIEAERQVAALASATGGEGGASGSNTGTLLPWSRHHEFASMGFGVVARSGASQTSLIRPEALLASGSTRIRVDDEDSLPTLVSAIAENTYSTLFEVEVPTVISVDGYLSADILAEVTPWFSGVSASASAILRSVEGDVLLEKTVSVLLETPGADEATAPIDTQVVLEPGSYVLYIETGSELPSHSLIDTPGSITADSAFVVNVTFEAVPPCPADLNHDGTVDGADLGLLLGAWGCQG